MAWLLVALRDDGKEMLAHGSFTTAMTLDGLLKHAKGLLPDGEWPKSPCTALVPNVA